MRSPRSAFSLCLSLSSMLVGCGSETAPASSNAAHGGSASAGAPAGGASSAGAVAAAGAAGVSVSNGAAGAGASLGGASGANSGGQPGQAGASAKPAHILGADVSWLLEDEASGASYYDAGVKQDLLVLLRKRGFNYIRIRTFVDPAAPGGYAAGKQEAWCDVAHTIELARRAREQGMGFLLDFHYSDDFADPGKQTKPGAWATLSFDELVARVHDYTHATVAALAEAGVSPDMVQVGNEITPGMLFPDGQSSNENWPRLGQLLKAGASAVQAAAPLAKVMLHVEKCGDNATTRWWVDHALAEGVPFQVLGQSCYTEYQGTPAEWQANFDDLVTRYADLSFVIAEYSHEKRKANDVMRSLPNGRGLGTFIWEPTRWMEAVFDRQGNRFDGNAWLDTYSQLAADYGLAL